MLASQQEHQIGAFIHQVSCDWLMPGQLTSDWSTDGAAAAPRGGRARPHHGCCAARGRAQPGQGQQGEQVQTRHPQAEGQNHRVRRGVTGGEYKSSPYYHLGRSQMCARVPI